MNEYAIGLMKGKSIDPLSKNKIAKLLSNFIGIPADTLLHYDLRLTTDSFEMKLLADKNMRVGKLNTRITQIKKNQNYSAREDPSLIVNTDPKKDAVGNYFRNTLGINDNRLYRGINFEVNAKWKWAAMDAYLGYYSVLPDLENAMQAHAGIKLFVAGGVYDLATPLYATKYLLEHSRIDAKNIQFELFPTGHSIFEDASQLPIFSKKSKHLFHNNPYSI